MALTVKPYPFQQKGIDYYFKHYWTMCGDEQGLGKTLQAIGLIARIGGDDNIVVCPASLKGTWTAEIRKFLPSHVGKIGIMSYDAFRKYEPRRVDCLIFDEAHYLKNPKSLRTIAAFQWAITYPPRYVLLLSGTPIKNNVTEFFAPIYLLSQCPFGANGEKYFQGHWNFCNQFSNRVTYYLGDREVSKYEGVRNVSALKKLLKFKYVRRLARNCLDLPDLVRKKVAIDNRKVDKKLAEAWGNYRDDGAYPTLKADCALAKASFTVKYALDLLREGPVLIYSDHRAPVFEIERKLMDEGHKVGSIVGGMPLLVRQKAIEGFQEGTLDVLVMTIGAASTGLTFTRSNHLIFNDITWVPADLQQAEKRIHRIGQTKTAFIHYCLSGDVDEHIFETVLGKAKLLKEVNNSVGKS